MKSACNYIIFLLFFAFSALVSCSNPSGSESLDRAESLMESHPDSALTILSGIEPSSLGSTEHKARYALLKSMALDKNYIDTTTFDVLQPAIDYYISNGTPDEKLKTYYYQGVIYQNQGDNEKALSSYTKAVNLSDDCTDSLAVARAFVAQGYLFGFYFDYENTIACNQKAAAIYKNLNMRNYESGCLMNILNGALQIKDKSLCDNMIESLQSIDSLTPSQQRKLSRHLLTYAMKFSSEQEIRELISKLQSDISSIDDILVLALANNKVGENDKAQQLLNVVKNCHQPYDTLRFMAITVPVEKGLGNYEGALRAYERFNHKQDSIKIFSFEQKIKSIEEKHQLEINAQAEASRLSRIIWGCVAGIILLAMCVIILSLSIRSKRAKAALAVERLKVKDAENATLKSEGEKMSLERDRLMLENKNLQLERDNKALEAENLSHRVELLETESENLKSLIDSQDEQLPHEVQDAIKVRIEMLNSLLAGYITDNNQYARPYDDWVKETTADSVEFMNSNRLAFQASHPKFIQYFEEHGLTTDEINYVCLYAIGLRGKEVGNYIKKRSHVNISSAIRKKLGIDKHETNLGIYVRKQLKNL